MFYFPSTYREYFFTQPIRVDPRDSPEINNQRDFTDSTDSHAENINQCNPCNHVDNKIFCTFRAFCVQKNTRRFL